MDVTTGCDRRWASEPAFSRRAGPHMPFFLWFPSRFSSPLGRVRSPCSTPPSVRELADCVFAFSGGSGRNKVSPLFEPSFVTLPTSSCHAAKSRASVVMFFWTVCARRVGPEHVRLPISLIFLCLFFLFSPLSVFPVPSTCGRSCGGGSKFFLASSAFPGARDSFRPPSSFTVILFLPLSGGASFLQYIFSARCRSVECLSEELFLPFYSFSELVLVCLLSTRNC